MGLFQRIGDIVTANLHEMVDRFEDPQAMLKQAIREMEAAIAQSLDRAAAVIASEKLLARQAAENLEASRHWQATAQWAVAAEDDPLARRALARKAEHQKLLAALEADRQEAEQTADRLRCQIGAMRAKLAEARRRLATLTARQHLASTRKGLTGVGSCEGPFAKYQRLTFSIEQAEAEADAFEQLSDVWPGLAGDDEEALRIEQELAELKASAGSAG